MNTSENASAGGAPSKLLPVVSVLIGLLFSLVLVEGAVRLFLFVRKPANWDDRPSFYYRPAQAATLQGNVYEVKKPKDVFRIAVVGDSVSFGPYLQYNDTFSSKLAVMLNLAGTLPRYEVINYGVPGYASRDELPVVQRALDEQADLVILQITLNDPELQPLNVTHEQNVKRFGPYRPEGWEKRVVTLWKTVGMLAEGVHNARTRRAYRQYFLDLYSDRASWDGFNEAVKNMVSLTRARQIRLVAVLFPLFGSRIDDTYPFTALHTQIGALLEQQNVPRLDLLSVYRNIPPERIHVIPGKDLHPNEIAHRLAAEALYRFLGRRKFLADDFEFPRLYLQRNAPFEPSVREQFIPQ